MRPASQNFCAVQFCLVFKLTEELGPAHIGNSTSQLMVLQHILDECQYIHSVITDEMDIEAFSSLSRLTLSLLIGTMK